MDEQIVHANHEDFADLSGEQSVKYLKSSSSATREKQREDNKCPHKKQRSQCIDCGGSSICEHNRQRSTCIDCDGGHICEHKKRKNQCIKCDLPNYLHYITSNRINHAKIERQGKSTKELLGCTMKEFKTHLESQFIDGMSWDTRDLWDIDHRIPLNYKNPETNQHPTLEEMMERLHFTNTKPMWKSENRIKGSRYVD